MNVGLKPKVCPSTQAVSHVGSSCNFKRNANVPQKGSSRMSVVRTAIILFIASVCMLASL